MLLHTVPAQLMDMATMATGGKPQLVRSTFSVFIWKMQINKYKDKDNIQLVRSTFVANEYALIFQMAGLSRKCTDRKKSSISSRKHIVIF